MTDLHNKPPQSGQGITDHTAIAQESISPEIPILYTEDGLELRQLATPEDDDVYLEFENNNLEHITEFGNKVYGSQGAVREARLRADSIVRMGIWKGGKFIGIVGALQREGEAAEVGILLAKDAGGHGYATSAVRKVTSFLVPNFKRVFAEVAVDNKRSAALMERSGYTLKGEVDREWGRALVFDFEKQPTSSRTLKVSNFGARLAARRAGLPMPEKILKPAAPPAEIPAERRKIARALAESKDEKREFRIAVEIKGVQYIFTGLAPQQPSEFEWYIGQPNSTDQPEVTKHLAHRLDNGTVGILSIDEIVTPDGAAAIALSRIETRYQDTKGVGSFLLDTICAYADAKSWRAYLHPQDLNGRLTTGELNSWYRKKGFRDDNEFPIEYRSGHYGMLRPPKPPENSVITAK